MSLFLSDLSWLDLLAQNSVNSKTGQATSHCLPAAAMDGWDAVATAVATVGAAAGLCYCASAGGDRSAQDRGCILVPGGAGYIGSQP
eukprot:COSAG06_NODE_6_length_38168_cov_131.592398_10_plen_87_part_00